MNHAVMQSMLKPHGHLIEIICKQNDSKNWLTFPSHSVYESYDTHRHTPTQTQNQQRSQQLVNHGSSALNTSEPADIDKRKTKCIDAE